MRSVLLTTVAVVALAALVACGIPGAPQPPSLELPRTVQNLQAVRKGDKVTLTWTTPRETTDRTRIKHLGVTRICRAVDVVTPTECVEKVGSVPPAPTPLAAAASFTDTLPKQLQEAHPTGFAGYAVEVENSHGRSAGVSNQVVVSIAPTLPPPGRLAAHVTADAVGIDAYGEQSATPAGLAFAVHLYRRTERGGTAVDLGEPAMIEAMGLNVGFHFVDHTAESEKTYLYHVTVVTAVPLPGRPSAQVLGDDSPEIEVSVHDVFPPAAPTGLEAVSSGTPQQPFIELSWAPNTESDLAGYNVYRHEEGAVPNKINAELVKGPTYRDSAVQAGHRYSYSVTAVDLRGNESARSAEASEVVPQ